MKPLRGKRVGSAQSARRIQPGGLGRPARDDGSPSPPPPPRGGGAVGDRRPDGPGPRRAHFHRGGAPRPALGRLGRPGRQVARRFAAASVTAPRQQLSPYPGVEGDDRRRAFPRRPPPSFRGGGRRLPGGRAPSLPARLSTGADCPQCAPTASRRRAGRATPGARGLRRCRPPTRPVLKHGPRSLTRARVRGSNESPWRNEGEGRRAPAEVGSRGHRLRRAHHRPVSPAPSGRWSMSVRARTRKMVNYAWAGRSQRKLWWRSVAVLTCKSVVRPGYRGERLIEPSSSWFPPKFPSG